GLMPPAYARPVGSATRPETRRARLRGPRHRGFRWKRQTVPVSVVALGQVVVGDHFGGGPFQRLALGALALGLLDAVDQFIVDLARGDLAQRQHGGLVLRFAVVDL